MILCMREFHKVAVIMRCPYYGGGCKVGFHYIIIIIIIIIIIVIMYHNGISAIIHV